MESVWNAVKSTFRKLCARFGKTLRRWSIKTLRNAIWRADEWCHEQELRLRDEAWAPEPVVLAEEFQVKASAARERVHKQRARAARPRLARLKYQHGEFVEVRQ